METTSSQSFEENFIHGKNLSECLYKWPLYVQFNAAIQYFHWLVLKLNMAASEELRLHN